MGNLRAAVAALCIVGAISLAVVAALVTASSTDPAPVASTMPVPSTSTRVPVVERAVPRFGDCGVYDGRTVEPVACSDPTADVEVGARHALGDPAATCPLYDRDNVLATDAGVGSLYICWVPIGGGPSRDPVVEADPIEATTTEPEWREGVCGNVHAEHVHAPLDCADELADGVVTAQVDEASACPGGTILALLASTGRTVCWGPR